jgi:hypothetical protein
LAGSRRRAPSRADLTAAAGQALARGELRAAALAYLDAAWIAQEQKNPRQVWELGHRAEMLADSPLLGAADRAAILQRIERAPEAVRVAMRRER